MAAWRVSVSGKKQLAGRWGGRWVGAYFHERNNHHRSSHNVCIAPMVIPRRGTDTAIFRSATNPPLLQPQPHSRVRIRIRLYKTQFSGNVLANPSIMFQGRSKDRKKQNEWTGQVAHFPYEQGGSLWAWRCYAVGKPAGVSTYWVFGEFTPQPHARRESTGWFLYDRLCTTAAEFFQPWLTSTHVSSVSDFNLENLRTSICVQLLVAHYVMEGCIVSNEQTPILAEREN